MSTSVAHQPLQAVEIPHASDSANREDDPFNNNTSQEQRRSTHRYSSFDTQAFAFNHPSASPTQAKRALEAHLLETDRRLDEASKLGTALVQQRKDLCDRLKEVEQQHGEREIGPELRQKLIEVEKEYHEIGRDSARAFLAPKNRLLNADEGTNGYFAPDTKRPPSPSKLQSQAMDLPSKLSVPSRKQRNQSANRVHDIEFATEISTSLLTQVRQLQAVLEERNDTLKATNAEKSQLELDALGMVQRLRTLNENEQRYKDENWALETRTHELLARVKESTEREQRLQQSLASVTTEKSSAQRDLDDVKQAHGNLVEEHVNFRKTYDSELASIRRTISSGEIEKGSLQRKIEELTSQNQELAKAVAGHSRSEEELPLGDISLEPDDSSLEPSEFDHSPPPSPSKGATRHTVLESETLKSSLQHAHRMIQSLKSNIHREKTEKLELKRMLQESRDDLELRRNEFGGMGTNQRKLRTKSQIDLTKKSAKFGIGRNSRTDIEVYDAAWEDHNGEQSPRYVTNEKSSGMASEIGATKVSDLSDHYQTANETEDAFETANERDTATETEAFQTGNEEMAGESGDDLTETEGDPDRSSKFHGSRQPLLAVSKGGKRSSFISTASTSGSDEEMKVKTPVQTQPQKYRLKINRGSRRSRMGSEGLSESNPSSEKNSPASFAGGNRQGRQSLFAELGKLDDNDSDEEIDGTPGRSSIVSKRSTSGSRPSTAKQNTFQLVEASPPRMPMVDSGTMTTDVWQPTQTSDIRSAAVMAPAISDMIPATPHIRDAAVQRISRGALKDTSRSNSVISAPIAWDQPLGNFVRNIPIIGSTFASTSSSANSGLHRDVQVGDGRRHSNVASSSSLEQSTFYTGQTTPSSDEGNHELNVPALNPSACLSFSPIQSVETRPVRSEMPAIPSRDVRRRPLSMEQSNASPIDPEITPTTSDKTGILDSVLGWAKSSKSSMPQSGDDREAPSVPVRHPSHQSRTPFGEIPANVAQQQPFSKDKITTGPSTSTVDMADQSSQTILSANYIDSLLSGANKTGFSATGGTQRTSVSNMRPLHEIGAMSPSPRRESSQEGIRSSSRASSVREAAPLVKSLRRPGSSGSARASNLTLPPLPPDHREAIAAAAQRTIEKENPPTVMGPPVAPASAYRSSSNKPRTPSEQRGESSNSRAVGGSRPRYSTARSRRSSVSSFASELDARFNIRTDGMPMPAGLEGGADPRMIQAITQTMIGEYLWKYTRKAGRGEMSDNRHRRFFWVHPYTRTLYWSEQDPSTAGRAQLKAKSVAIDAVRVVTDDNPMPPGLHRKSLVILTPGRAVKFTATTGQRHETWFNALSYLLLRTGPEPKPDNNNLTTEDVAEFNPSYNNITFRTVGSRSSLSTYQSRTPRSASRIASHGSSRDGSPMRTQSQLSSRTAPVQPQTSTTSRDSEAMQGSFSSRLSSYWKPHGLGRSSVRGSFSSQRSRLDQAQQGGDNIYDASVVHDSAEDLRQVMEEQEAEADRLENVRACCDGKHDVGSLVKRHGGGSRASRQSHAHSHTGAS